MIIPSARNTRLFAATILPIALAASVAPEQRGILAAVSLLLSLLVAADALIAVLRSRDVSVGFPERLVLSRDREAVIPFTVSAAGNSSRALSVALHTPEGFNSPVSEHAVQLPAGQEGVRIKWRITGRRRGDHRLQHCRLRLLSPLGLWHAQRTLPAGTLLKVYPNLREERKQLAALFLNRNDLLVRPQRQVGQGRDFEKLRLYLPGDPMGDIHWRATAKRAQLVTKEFRIERTQEVYVVVDASRLSAKNGLCGKSLEPLLERYIRAALILGNVAHSHGDLFGVTSFSDRVLGFVPARAGKEHAGVCRDALYTLASARTNPGYDEVATFLAPRLKRRALLIFLTSLEEPALAESFLRSIRVLSRRHLVCVAMVRPTGSKPLFSGAPAAGVDDIYRCLAGHTVWHNLRELQQTLKLRGVQLSLVDDEKLTAEVVAKYLDVKRRQLL